MLARYSPSADGIPAGGLTIDTAGNIYGFTSFGGTSGYGAIFEIAKTGGGYSGTPSNLINLTTSAEVNRTLIVVAAGNLFGTTAAGGTNGDGTVFEIAKGSGTMSTLANFNGANGAAPLAGVTADAAGNLFGTTSIGGTSNLGTVFEISDSGYQVACFCADTYILTPHGEVAVENLAIGDYVMTVDGGPKRYAH